MNLGENVTFFTGGGRGGRRGYTRNSTRKTSSEQGDLSLSPPAAISRP